MAGGLHNHLDWGLLEYAGMKDYTEHYGREEKVIHFRIDSKLNMGFAQVPREFPSGKRFEYHFGTFEWQWPNGFSGKDSRLLRVELSRIKNSTPRRKASELNHYLISSLCHAGFGKLVANYYKKCWPLEKERWFSPRDFEE